jgi:polar amino acid transport system permease protein
MIIDAQLYSYLPLLLKGLLATALLSTLTALLSTGLGLLLGIICSMRNAWATYITPIVDVYIFVWRGVPIYVQLLVAYFALPEIIKINLSPTTACVAALTLCSAAYVTNIVRSCINAIPQGQWEAAQALGLSNIQTLLFVIMPQASKLMLPLFINEYESIIKSTALFSAIGVPELTKIARNIIAKHLSPVGIYAIVVCFYLILSGTLAALSCLVRQWLKQAESQKIR